MAPAMSIRCITVPPRMKPSGLASFGSTTWTISVAESVARFGVRSTAAPGSASEVVADPTGEARLAELGGAADAPERAVRRDAGAADHDFFPALVHQRPPRPVEVDGEAERERFEAET